MLKQASSLFRNVYWLALNLPFFMGSAIIAIATYEEGNLNILIMIIAIISLLSIFYLDYQLFRINTKLPQKSTLSFKVGKRVTGQKLAICELVLGILCMLPSIFNLSMISFVIFFGVTALLYFLEIGTNCRILPIYLLAFMHPCFNIINADHTHGIAYVANDDDVQNADKYIQNTHVLLNSESKSELIHLNKKHTTEAMFIIK